MKSIYYYIGFVIGYVDGRRKGRIMAKNTVKYGGFENIPPAVIRKSMGKRAESLLFAQNVKIMALSICKIYEETVGVRPDVFMSIVADYLESKPVPKSFNMLVNSDPTLGVLLNYIAYTDNLHHTDGPVRKLIGTLEASQ